jgi:hypothetical protein
VGWGRSRSHAEKRVHEQEPDQQAPEAAAGGRVVHQLVELDAGLSLDRDGSVADRDQVLLHHLEQALPYLLGLRLGRERDCDEISPSTPPVGGRRQGVAATIEAAPEAVNPEAALKQTERRWPSLALLPAGWELSSGRRRARSGTDRSGDTLARAAADLVAEDTPDSGSAQHARTALDLAVGLGVGGAASGSQRNGAQQN